MSQCDLRTAVTRTNEFLRQFQTRLMFENMELVQRLRNCPRNPVAPAGDASREDFVGEWPKVRQQRSPHMRSPESTHSTTTQRLESERRFVIKAGLCIPTQDG